MGVRGYRHWPLGCGSLFRLVDQVAGPVTSSISMARTPGTSWMRSSAWRTRSAPSGWSLTALALIRLRAGGPACAAMHGAVSRCSSGSAPRCPDGSAFELPGCPARIAGRDHEPDLLVGAVQRRGDAPQGPSLLAGGGDGLALGALVQVAEGAVEGGQRAEAFVEGGVLEVLAQGGEVLGGLPDGVAARGWGDTVAGLPSRVTGGCPGSRLCAALSPYVAGPGGTRRASSAVSSLAQPPPCGARISPRRVMNLSYAGNDL